MFITVEDDKFYELMYAECSQIVSTKHKEENDLWCEVNDGMYLVHKSCRLVKEQFGIIGIQVTGCTLRLNVLIRDEVEVHRYYKLQEPKIPIQYSNDPSILAELISTLLIFRNILSTCHYYTVLFCKDQVEI
nr:13352_t:CDS:1 [Entrophospora candida]